MARLYADINRPTIKYSNKIRRFVWHNRTKKFKSTEPFYYSSADTIVIIVCNTYTFIIKFTGQF